MKALLKIIIPFLFIISCNNDIVVKELSKTTTSWDGKNIIYPSGNEEITTTHITIPPNAKLPFHCHPVPTLAYVISGKIKVETMEGKTKLFKAGEEIIEVVNSWHRGYNPSRIKPVKIIVFYAGQKSLKNTIMYDKENQECVSN